MHPSYRRQRKRNKFVHNAKLNSLTNRFHAAERLFLPHFHVICELSVIVHRWRQNVVRTNSNSRSPVCHWGTFWRPLCPYWTDARQHGIYLFYIIRKQTTTAFFYFKIFLNARKPDFAHFGKHEKKAIWRNLLSIQNEAIWLVAMRSKDLWLVHKNYATVKLDSNSFSWNENLQRKQNRTAKSTNVKENAEKTKSVFVMPCEPKNLDVALNVTGVERTCSENLHWPFYSSFKWKER